jgi:hypothetical protein
VTQDGGLRVARHVVMVRHDHVWATGQGERKPPVSRKPTEHVVVG